MRTLVTRIHAHRLNVAKQALDFLRLFPRSEVRTGPGWVTWIGELKPTEQSQTYRVMIEYRGYGRPVITILSPKLVPPDGKKLVHIFEGDHPCVHMPDDWHPSMYIARTIVPWLSEWLFHYEIYRATGVWTGGGHEPTVGPKREPTGRRS